MEDEGRLERPLYPFVRAVLVEREVGMVGRWGGRGGGGGGGGGGRAFG